MSKKGKHKKDHTPSPPNAETRHAQDSPALKYGAAAARTIVGLVFLVSGIHKAAAPAQEFAVVIEAYRLISPAASITIAKILPSIEILVGLAMVLGFAVKKASAASGVFFLVFIMAIGSTIMRGIELANCGCFGAGIHLTPPQAITLDSALLCLSYLAYRKGQAFAPLESWISQGTLERTHAR